MMVNRKRGKFGISKIVGEAILKSGETQSAYLALRQLLCARCGKVIHSGDYFTRKLLAGVPVPISPRCQDCVPFELGLSNKTVTNETEAPPVKEQSAMLKSLLESDDKKSAASSMPAKEETEEKFLSRLGPALEKTRKTKPNKGS